MSKKNKSKDTGIDLSGFSDEDIRSLYKDSQRGVRRQGYDDSNDTTVDYTPSAEDAIYAASAVTSDWKGGKWDDVRDQVKQGYSEEDLIHEMRGAVSGEYMRRRDDKLADMNSRIDANTNREFEAPAAEQKEEEPVVDSQKLSDAKDRVKAYESNIRQPGEGNKYGVFGEGQTTTEPQPIKTETDPEPPQQQAPSTKYELDVDEDSQSVADDFLAKYKVDLMDGKKFSK